MLVPDSPVALASILSYQNQDLQKTIIFHLGKNSSTIFWPVHKKYEQSDQNLAWTATEGAIPNDRHFCLVSRSNRKRSNCTFDKGAQNGLWPTSGSVTIRPSLTVTRHGLERSKGSLASKQRFRLSKSKKFPALRVEQVLFAKNTDLAKKRRLWWVAQCCQMVLVKNRGMT
uniref:Uncharacterized protein n=1 Tax=Romanomermis culicivorax TaxID=13658 RepID=A0A915K5D6_ROMCU